MKQRALGKSGLLVSVTGLGTNNFGGRTSLEDARKVVHKALDLGITLIDTAEMYGNGRSEEVLGITLGDRRKDVLLATKWSLRLPDKELRCGSRDYIMKAVERSLAFLKTDYIDLYQFHFPDPKTPIEETLGALGDLIRQGKVRYIGVSNMPAWRIVEAQLIAKQMGMPGFISFQDAYNVLNRAVETSLFPATDAYGLGLLPYSPLASGLLSGKYKRNAPMPEDARLTKATGVLRDRVLNDRNWEIVERLTDFAEARGHSLLELALSWLLSQPQVASVIAGATKPEQLEQNAAATSWEMTAEELVEIAKLTA